MDIDSHEELVLFLNSLDDEINESMIAANRDPEKLEQVSVKLDRLCEFIGCEESERCWKRWGGRDDFKRSAERIRETSSKALCAVEKRRAIRMYADQRDDSLYQTLLSASVITECRLAQIGRSAKVLFIGAGAFPISACTIARETSATVCCTDIDEEAICHGSRLIKFLGLHKNVIYSDSPMGDEEYAGSATHIFMASLVPEKLDILDTIKFAAKPDCKMILRYGNGLKSVFNYPLHADLSGVWDVEPVAGNNCIYDTLILKAPQAAVASPTC
jgi:hypothetical protein